MILSFVEGLGPPDLFFYGYDDLLAANHQSLFAIRS